MNRITGLFQKLFLSTLFFCFFLATLRAQSLQATASNTPPFTPQNLITNIFLGDGVEVTNITFNGEPAAVGYFTGGTQSIGIERGIVMTSGAVESSGGVFGTVGCNETGNDFASTDNLIFMNDPDLAALTTSGIRDLSSYTITFIPTDSLLSFKYCFGSEEYPEYSCSPYNDVFGFFISGPNPAGGNYNNQNIAIIPGTSLPVTINNLHPANPAYPNCNPTNAQYYNNNNFTNNQPSYDGFTDVFTAEAKVIPCQSYTIKLAIADVSDGVFDSGVFLEAKSFGTGSLQVEVATASLDGTIVEGCSQGSIKFMIPNALQQNLDIDFKIWGTATNGADYQTIPTVLSIPAGQTEVVLPIISIEDNTPEAPEYIAVDVQRDPCNRDTFYLYIKDNGLVKPTLRPDTVVCVGAQPLQLDGTLPIALPAPPTFTNTQDYSIAPVNTAVNSPINVFGVQPALLDSGVIRSVCMKVTHSWDDDLDVFLISPSGQFIELTTDNGRNSNNMDVCFTPTATKPVTSINDDLLALFPPLGNVPGADNTTYFQGEFAAEGPWSDLWDGDYPTNGSWRLQIRDDANGFIGTLNEWSITFEPSYKVNYQWSPTAGLSCPTCPLTDASPTQPTTYTVLATDSYGCTVTDSVTLDVATALAAPVVTCNGSTNNSVTFGWANIPGATNYQVNVNNAGWVPIGNLTSYTVNGLAPGANVTIEVQGGGAATDCDGLIGTAVCSNCEAPIATANATPVSCFGGNNGSLTVNTDGLNPPYTYALGAQTNATGIFQNLTAGSYVVSVTDASGCSTSVSANVATPSQCMANVSVIDNVSCFGGTDGSLSVTASGGVAPYTYLWSDPAAQNTPVANNLSAGNYTVTVTDANNCSVTATGSVTQPPDLVLSALGSLAKCFGESSGSASASATGGTPPYNFAWSNMVNGQQNPNLAAGNYFVTVTDGNGCAETAFVSIGQPPQLTATASTVPAKCDGSADGTATVTPTGGTGPYTYKWSDPAGQSTQTATGLPAQTYTVTVTDSKGCSVTQTATVTAPPALMATVSKVNALCNGATGSATATPGGGTPPYSYKWSDPAGQTGATANLLAGTYTVTVTDQAGCTIVSNVTINQPEAIQLTATITDVSCSGAADGQIVVQTAGGTPPFNFIWDSGENTATITGKTAGDYIVTATDANGCTAVLQNTITEATELLLDVSTTDIKCFGENNGAIALTATGGSPNYNILWSGPNNFTSNLANLSDLFAGTYNVTVTDNAGCSKTWTGEILQPASALLLDLPDIADTICFQATDGSATASPTGGTPPYVYLWNVGNQSTSSITGLNSAIYKVTVTDANGCSQTDSTFVFQKEELFATAEALPPSCFNQATGSASVTAVFYGATNANIDDFDITWSTTPPQTAPKVVGLMPGTSYTVTVTDSDGCSDTQTVTVGNAVEFVAQIIEFTNAKCFGEATGSATAGAVGGTAPYSYFWAAGGQTNAQAQNLAAGTYAVTVTDVNNCPATTTVTISQPPALELDLFPTDVKCFGESNGGAKAVPAGGTPPYSYLWWNNGQQTSEITGLPAGIAGVSVTDANGCQISDSVEIEQPATGVAGSAEKRDPKCFGGRDGEITITASGGTGPYRYALGDQPFNGSPRQISLGAGIYTPKIMDKNGCVVELPPIEINQRDPVQVELGPDITIELGESTQLFTQVLNAAGQVSYSWTAEDSTWLSCLNCADPFVDSLYYSEYFAVKVRDSLGCVGEDRIQVIVEKPRKIFVPTGFTPNGDFTNDLLQVHGQSTAKVLEFRVFDRWGELVYEASNFQVNDTATGWDGNFRGEPMDPGVYVWVLQVEYMDGVKEVFKGNTTLIR